MTTWRRTKELFSEIMDEIDNPDITLITMDEWTKIFKDRFDLHDYGMSFRSRRIITVRYIDTDEIDIKDSIWHEILHVLYPEAPHWQIECVAQRLSGSKEKGKFSRRYGHSINNVPYRNYIIDHIKNDKNLHAKIGSYRWEGYKKPKRKNWRFKIDEKKRKYITFL